MTPPTLPDSVAVPSDPPITTMTHIPNPLLVGLTLTSSAHATSSSPWELDRRPTVQTSRRQEVIFSPEDYKIRSGSNALRRKKVVKLPHKMTATGGLRQGRMYLPKKIALPCVLRGKALRTHDTLSTMDKDQEHCTSERGGSH